MRRTLSGEVVHNATWEFRGDRLRFLEVSSLATAVHASPSFAAAELEFLARIFLEGVICPFPIAPGLTKTQTAEIAISGWREYGRLAQFGRMLTS